MSSHEKPVRISKVGFVIAAISLIGAVMLGMGVILFFAANWDKVTPMQKTGLIFAGIAAAYLIGYEFRFGRWNMPIIGEAILLVGALFYGAGIWLVAQIFNIQEHYPNGALLWGLGLLPVAIVLPSMIVTVLASLLFLLYFGLECAEVASPNFIYLGLVVAMLWAAYKFKSRLLLFINYVGLSSWFVAGLAILDPSQESIGPGLCLVVFAGIAALLLGRAYAASEEGRYLSPIYFLIGFFDIFVPLYLMTFGTLVKEIHAGFGSREGLTIVVSGLALFTLISFFAAGLLAVREKQNAGGRIPYQVFIEAAVVAGIAIVAVAFFIFKSFLMQQTFFDHSLIAILFNIVLGIVLIEMIAVGYTRDIGNLVGLGFLGVVVLLATRYFDMFWGLMSRSQFFMIGGLLLLFVAWAWERMRKGLQSTRKEVAHA